MPRDEGFLGSAATAGAVAVDRGYSMEDWWTEIDDDVLRVLAGNGAMAPGELAQRLGISEAATASLLSMLALAGRVRICLVESR